MTEANGRIKLSWSQATWGVAMLVAVLATWYDLRVGQARLEERIIAMEKAKAAEHARTDRRLERLEDRRGQDR